MLCHGCVGDLFAVSLGLGIMLMWKVNVNDHIVESRLSSIDLRIKARTNFKIRYLSCFYLYSVILIILTCDYLVRYLIPSLFDKCLANPFLLLAPPVFTT